MSRSSPVALLAEGVDRNPVGRHGPRQGRLVALLAEGVDRNSVAITTKGYQSLSPSSRRAWIEIIRLSTSGRLTFVSLLAEGADRNRTCMMRLHSVGGCPPRGGYG